LSQARQTNTKQRGKNHQNVKTYLYGLTKPSGKIQVASGTKDTIVFINKNRCKTQSLLSSCCLIFLFIFYLDGDGSNYLPNWAVGIIAVAVFLVLAFAFLLFNHYVCVRF